MEVKVEIDEESPDKIRVDMPALYKDLLLSIPGASYSSKSKSWSLPKTYPGMLALKTTFKHELIIGSNLLEWVQDEWNNRVGPALAMRDVVDPTEGQGYDFLYPHQRGAAEFLSLNKRAILSDDLGSGKTISVLATIRRLAEQGENPFPVLVVAPNSTKIGWSREVEKVWPGLKVQVVSGTATRRKKQLKEPAHVYIMNWEAVKGHSRLAPYGNVSLKKCEECGGHDPKITPARCQVHLKELNGMDFQTVIADEAHKMKDGSAQTTRAVKAATGDAPFRFALTGTPIANSMLDLWSILNWLDPAAFPSKTKYIDRYLDVSVNYFGGTEILGIKRGMEEEFFGIINPILRRMPKEVILPFLPPVIRTTRYVDMTPKQMKAYEQMRDKMVAELDDGSRVTTTSALTKMLRLQQFAAAYAQVETEEVWDKETGEQVIDPETGEPMFKDTVTLSAPSAKIDAFMDDIDAGTFGDSSVIVFSPWKQMLDLVAKKMDSEGISYGRITGDENGDERQHWMDMFQEGRVKYILVTTSAGGAGITLTKSDIAVYLGRPWSNIDSQQSEGRNHRIGSEVHDNITYVDYITSGTVESAVFEALEGKNLQLQTVLRDKETIRKAMMGEAIE